jgi:hypothetical protein
MKRSNINYCVLPAAFAERLRTGTVAEGVEGRRGGSAALSQGRGGGGGRLKGADLLHLEHGHLSVKALQLGLCERQT